jgi:hypothetical protein
MRATRSRTPSSEREMKQRIAFINSVGSIDGAVRSGRREVSGRWKRFVRSVARGCRVKRDEKKEDRVAPLKEVESLEVRIRLLLFALHCLNDWVLSEEHFIL